MNWRTCCWTIRCPRGPAGVPAGCGARAGTRPTRRRLPWGPAVRAPRRGAGRARRGACGRCVGLGVRPVAQEDPVPTMPGEGILIAIAIAYSAAVAAIGRRLPRPASVAASSTAVAILIAVPLLPDPAAQLVDRVVPVVGAGRLLVHLAFMTVACGLCLTIVLGTRRWAWPQQLAVGGAWVLTALFVLLW